LKKSPRTRSVRLF